MNIVFHLGLHATDGGLLIRSILQNRALLAREGVAVPGPLRYRELLGEMSTALRGAPASPEAEAEVLAAIGADPTAGRVILSNEHFLCRPDVAFDRERLYPKAEKSGWLRNCLPSHEVEFALALRNPAGLIPDLVSAGPGTDILRQHVARGLDLGEFRWSDVVARIRDANPGCRIVTWCHEDTPYLWLEIMRELTQSDPLQPLDGEFDMVESIVTPEGYRRLTEFVTSQEAMTQSRRRRAVAAFLEAHALKDQIEAEIDLPGWTLDLVDVLSEFYDQDVAEVAQMQGVTHIAP